jgi:hypothetical protein
MIGEYNSEKTTLAQYMLQASGEIKNRASIINDYDERERNLDSILALESEIVSIATDFNSTDCAEENSRYAGCSQADYANGLMKELDSRFSAKEVLEQKSRQAVSSRNAIPKPPENLWLLDILGKTTDLNRASSDLDKYSDQIDSRIASINAKIQQYQDAERDCDHPPALTCLNEKPQMEIEER